MPTLSSAGIGSGLDVSGLVSQLVSAERAPVAGRLGRAEQAIKLELSAFGQFRSALDGIQSAVQALADAESLDARAATVADDSPFSATAQPGAAMGNFQIEVQQLAHGQRLASATPLASADTDVGYGTLDLQLGSDTFSVDIAAGGQSLANVRDAINNASDNPGLNASILNTDAGAVLQLTSGRSGSDSAIAVSASGGNGGLTSLVGDLAQTQAAQDAIVQVNGYQVTSSSNTLDEVIDGVSFTLTKADPGTEYSLGVGRDNEAMTQAMQGLVEAYNTYVDKADQLGGFDSAKNRAGALNGDAMLRGFNSQLRQAVGEEYGEQGSRFDQFGLDLDVDGRLSLDEDALANAASADFSKLRDFLGGDNGFAARIDGLAAAYLDDEGAIDSREDSLNQRLDRLDVRGDALDARMEQVRARYLKQFSALDAMLAQMQQTSSFLGQQLSSLPGAGQK